MPSSNQDKFIRDEFRLFRKWAREGKVFTFEDLKAASKRTLNDASWRTYWDKKWKQFCVEVEDDHFRVRNDFLRLDPNDFASVYRQAITLYADYEYSVYPSVLVFEFFLPLTHERKLQASLDAIFYEDDLRAQLAEIGQVHLANALGRPDGTAEDVLVSEALTMIGGNFGGYSISHVNGRFRMSDLKSRENAAKLLASGRNYVIDETTAVVRFIFPIGTKLDVDLDSTQPVTPYLDLKDQDIDSNANHIRNILIHIFVRALVRTVKYEDEIWLLETGRENRLWKLAANKKDHLTDIDALYDDDHEEN